MNPSLRPALGSLAAMAALSLAPVVKGQAVLSSISNLTVANGDIIDIDIDGDGTNDFFLNSVNSPRVFGSLDTGDSIFSNGGAGVTLKKFSFGATIASSGDTTNDLTYNLLSGTTGYIGVSFQHDGSTHAAWLLLDLTASNGDIVVESAGWQQTANASITAGSGVPVPEPANVAAGLGFLAGLAVWLRRRLSR